MRIEYGDGFMYGCDKGITTDVLAYIRLWQILLEKPRATRSSNDIMWCQGLLEPMPGVSQKVTFLFVQKWYLKGQLDTVNGRRIGVRSPVDYDDDPRHYGVGL